MTKLIKKENDTFNVSIVNSTTLTADNYYSSDFISQSKLKKVCDGINNFFKPTEVTDAMQLGQVAHLLLLQPDLVAEKILVLPDKYGYGSTTTKASTEFIAENKTEKTEFILSANDFKKALKMNEVANSEQLITDYLNNKDLLIESPMSCEFHGLPIKFKPDVIDLQNKVIIDYKTASRRPTIENMQRVMFDYRYYFQAAFYVDAVSEALKTQGFRFIFLFQNTCDDFEFNMIEVSEFGLNYGRNNNEDPERQGYINAIDTYKSWVSQIENGKTNVSDYKLMDCDRFHLIGDWQPIFADLPNYAKI